MTENVTVKPSGTMIALGCITLVLSAYGLFGLLTLAHTPAWLAVLGIAGVDLFALAAGKHAIDVARDGDSPAAWNLIVVLVGIVGAVAQFQHMLIIGAPWVAGLIFAMFPVATILLFEGTLRRAARLAGRESGRVAAPRATFEWLQWLVYRRATWSAFRIAVADRSLGSDGAFKIGLITTAPRPEQRQEKRRDVAIDYPALLALSGARVPLAITGGGSDNDADTSGGDRDTSGGQPVSVAALVRAAVSEGAGDLAAVTEHVRAVKPDAPADTIRRAYQRVAS